MLTADLLIINADVRTMNPLCPRTEALAVFGSRIAALGSTAEILELSRKSTRVIDASGNTVLPGFNDAHVHFLAGGCSLGNINLRTARSLEELRSLLAAHARTTANGQWICGGDWNHENWSDTESRLPSREDIDSATPSNPVLLNRLDGHMSLANSMALKLAGITRHTADPPGGVIERDAKTGEPTGILKDAAEKLVRSIIPERTLEQKLSDALAATNFAASLGVTSVTDMSADGDVGVYQTLRDRGELKTRIYAARSIVDWEVLARTGLHAPFGDDMVRVGAIKGFADGSLGSSTALFFEPYRGSSANRGLLFEQMLPEGIMLERALAADRAGLQLMIHAIGDEANLRILDLFASLAERNGKRDRRFRIEHAQHLRPAEVPRFGRQEVIASMQPFHAADDGCWCERRIGPERARQAYSFRSLLDSGAMLSFGSDWTVAPLDPLRGIKAAVTRETLDGRHPGGWIPEQRISLQEALYAYTAGSAYAEFSENRKGTLAPGKLADVVILDAYLDGVAPMELDRVVVAVTILGGKVVYEMLHQTETKDTLWPLKH